MTEQKSVFGGRWDRRRWLRFAPGIAGGLAAQMPVAAQAAPAPAENREGWTPAWDKALLDAAIAKESAEFDSAERMVRREVGPEYRYHSALRSQTVHPTRESLHYALLLLEQADAAGGRLAMEVIDRLLSLQDVDPASRWYGLWGWYLEEPAAQMQPADWNWADFLGSLLLLIRHRHGHRLGDSLRGRVDTAIHHAAYSVMRRNVSMGYTNIAIKGTFVTLAAAELLEDAKLRAYARERLRRFSAEVDRTGSYNEYNSPTYNRVGIENFTRMRMVWKDADAIAQAARLEERMWDHFSRRWHVGTRQLAGPMSRCYSTEIGHPLWLQKALGNMVRFAELGEIRSGKVAGDAETSYLDFRCPSRFTERFVEAGKPRMVREIFLAAEKDALPTQGSTWLTPDLALGSVNQGDWWVQRRPVLGWFRDGAGGAVALQMRVMKDDYDFSSARIYSVQHENRILGVVNFQSPGGDKHISLDPIAEGRFQARSLRIQVDLSGGDFEVLKDQSLSVPGSQRRNTVNVIRIGRQRLRVVTMVCGGLRDDDAAPYRTGSGEALSLHVPWFGTADWQGSGPREVSWGTTPATYGVFHVEVLPEGVALPGDTGRTSVALREDEGNGTVTVEEVGYPELLSLVAGATVESAARQNARFDGGRIGQRAVPLVRLSEVQLAGLFRP